MRLIIPFLLIPVLGTVALDQMLTNREGVGRLNPSKKQELENQIDENVVTIAYEDQRLYLSLNVENGSKLQLTDGRTYLIDPEDQLYTVYWITPIPIQLGVSGDPNYPVKITNMNTGTSVKGKEISRKQLLEKNQAPVQLEQQPSPPTDQGEPSE